jgi:tetratricopeptide (TPR) repeat protein
VPTDLRRVREVLEQYGLPDDPDWRTRAAVEALPPADRRELLVTLSDACLLMARSNLQSEDGGADAARAAERWNVLADTIRPGPTPRAVYSQRANIFARLDRQADARAMLETAENTPLLTAEDHFLCGDDLLAAGRPADAAAFLRTAVRLDPTHFWAQFQLGVCHHLLGRPHDARGCYSAAIALRPDFPFAHFNRAMAGVPLQAHADVIADLDAVLALEPTNAPALLHRAHALTQAGDRVKALADLDAVLAAPDPGGMHVRAYLQRARVKKLAGDATGATADTAAALPLTPTDEIGWLMRGLAQLDTDPAAALSDIRQAVKLNPQYVTALRNEVHVLEKLKRYDEAAAVMERVLPLAPKDMLLLASSGVLNARISKADVAEKQVTTALAGDRSAVVRMSAATTYALLSAKKPELKPKAIKLLDELVKEGLSPGELKTEPDFAALRDDPEFQKLVGGK